MEGGIEADGPLDYAAIQILPNQHRGSGDGASYEAFIYSKEKVEKLATGVLEQLLLHLPQVNDLYAKESDGSFKIQPPEDLRGAAWFTKSVFNRFLHIVGSPDLIDVIDAIEDEMFQLKDAKKFHLSLYDKDHDNQFGRSNADICNSIDVAPSNNLKGEAASTDVSKNDLLRAMDLRFTALRRDLTLAFHKAVGSTCSSKEISDLAQFSEHVGATDLKNSLCKFLELTQEMQVAAPLNDNKASSTCNPRNENINKTDMNAWISKPELPVVPVKYGVSPAKVAQVERVSSSESEEFSDPSDGDQTAAERSRTLIRSASPRRSASPMRRIQIGKSGSRRAAALTIKSLSYVPVRERASSHRNVSSNNSEDEAFEQPTKRPEINAQRISVQDAICLFESKQRDHAVDIQKRRSLTNISTCANKSVLRKWSAGVGEVSSQDQQEVVSGDSIQEVTNNPVENPEVDVEFGEGEEKANKLVYTQADTNDFQANAKETQGEEIVGKSTALDEWNQHKEVDLNHMVSEIIESKPVRHAKPQTNRNKKSSEQRGGLYDHYKEKRDEKLREENSRKQAEREAQLRAMQQILNERKAEMAFAKGNDVGRKDAIRNPQKSLKSSSQLVNNKRETSELSTSKKVSSKTSPLPATRKSWQSTPSPRATRRSPSKTPGGISSAGTATRRQNLRPASSLPQSSPKVEKSQFQLRNLKDTPSDHDRREKVVNEKKQERVINSSRTTKTKFVKASGDCSGIVPTKPSFYNKVTKKSSIVPLESKPFLRKGSRSTSAVSPVNKKKNSPQAEDSLISCKTLTQAQESEVVVSTSDLVSHDLEENVVPLDLDAAAVQSETQISSHWQRGETESFDQVAACVGKDLNNKGESSFKLQVEGEANIPLSAWVEIEEHQELPIQCDVSTSQLACSAVPPVGLSTLRVRHSLSQMLQEESSEPDFIEWGAAENPPVMVCQKEAPKGLKRLLKFARKSKGDVNTTGWSSPSVFSEGEDDAEDSISFPKGNADNFRRKAAPQAKNFSLQKTSLSESYERNSDAQGLLPSKSNSSSCTDQLTSHKLQESCNSVAAPKATRSFFSLSAFRGGKPNDTKRR